MVLRGVCSLVELAPRRQWHRKLSEGEKARKGLFFCFRMLTVWKANSVLFVSNQLSDAGHFVNRKGGVSPLLFLNASGSFVEVEEHCLLSFKELFQLLFLC